MLHKLLVDQEIRNPEIRLGRKPCYKYSRIPSLHKNKNRNSREITSRYVQFHTLSHSLIAFSTAILSEFHSTLSTNIAKAREDRIDPDKIVIPRNLVNSKKSLLQSKVKCALHKCLTLLGWNSLFSITSTFLTVVYGLLWINVFFNSQSSRCLTLFQVRGANFTLIYHLNCVHSTCYKESLLIYFARVWNDSVILKHSFICVGDEMRCRLRRE